LTASARSRNPCGSRHEGGSCYHSGQIIQGGSLGNVSINPGSQGPRNQHGQPARDATRRLINPCVVTPVTISTPISMPAIASSTIVPSGIRQSSNIGRSATTNTVTPSASDHSKLSSRRDPAPRSKAASCIVAYRFQDLRCRSL